jgi:putative transposase
MSGDAHVRICESLGVKFPRATRLFARINGKTFYLWRAVDHEGEVLESFVTKRRDRQAALKFLRKAMKRYGSPKVIVTHRLRS